MSARAVRVGSAAVFLASCLFLLGGAAAFDGVRKLESRFTGEPWDVCAFKATHGVGCVGCGGTRAFRAAAHGHFAAAFDFNRLGAVVAVLTWGIAAGALASTIFGQKRYVMAALAGALVTLPIALVLHTWLWWRTLPPGLHFG
jgi:hypothetical protein